MPPHAASLRLRLGAETSEQGERLIRVHWALRDRNPERPSSRRPVRCVIPGRSAPCRRKRNTGGHPSMVKNPRAGAAPRFLPSSAADVDRLLAFVHRVTLVPASVGPPAVRIVLRRLRVPRSGTSPRSYDGPNAWLSGLTLKRPQRDHGLPHVDWPPLSQRRRE